MALWLVALGAFSLAISYVVPVAATLAAGTGATISPLRELAAPTLEFPALSIPTVTPHTESVPPAPTMHHLASAQSGVSSAGAGTSSGSGRQSLPIVTSAYTTRPAPRQAKSNDANLPVYEDSIGTIPAMPVIAGASDAQVTAPADAAPAGSTTTTTAAASNDGWAPASSAPTTTQSPQPRRWLSASHAGSIASSGGGAADASTIEESAPDLTEQVTPVATTIDTPSAPTTSDASTASDVVSESSVTPDAPSVSSETSGSQDGSAVSQQAPDQAQISLSSSASGSTDTPTGGADASSALAATDENTSVAPPAAEAEPTGTEISNSARGPPEELVVDATDDAEHTISLGSDGSTITVTVNGVTESHALADVSSVKVVGAADRDDTLSVNLQALPTDLRISYDGGARGFDTLVIAGGSWGTIYSAPNDAQSGTITFDGHVITYTNIEPLSAGGTATDVVFDLGSLPDFDALLAPQGGGLRLSGTTFETTDFATPTGSLTINGGDQRDRITLQGTIALGAAALTVTAEEIVVTGAITTTGNVTLTASDSISGGLGGGGPSPPPR